MAFIIRTEIKQNLSLISKLPTEVLIDFCKLAIDYMNNGPNEKRYIIIAKKLDTSAEDIQLKIKTLLCLLIDCTKNNVGESDIDQLKTLNYSDEQISILWQFLSSKKNIVDNLLKNVDSEPLRFRDLEWRVEAQIASRNMLSQAIPIITMKLHLDSEVINDHKDRIFNGEQNPQNTKKREVLLETDPCNLKHIISVLEQALIESKTHRTRNFVKVFQQ